MSGDLNSHEVDVALDESSNGRAVTLNISRKQLVTTGVVVAALVVGLTAWKFVFGGSDFAGMLNTASSEIHAGSYAPAEALLQNVISQNTTNQHNYNAIAYYDLGVSAQKQGRLQDAISYYSRCLMLAPEYRNAWYNKAVAEMTTNRAQALSDFDHVLSKYPNDSSSLYNSGLLMYRAGNTAEGIVRMKRAISLDSKLAYRVPSDINLG